MCDALYLAMSLEAGEYEPLDAEAARLRRGEHTLL